MRCGVSSEGDGHRESPIPTHRLQLGTVGGGRDETSGRNARHGFAPTQTRTRAAGAKPAGRRAAGFSGKRTATRPGSSSRREAAFDPSLTASRVDILSGLRVDMSSAAPPAARPFGAPAARAQRRIPAAAGREPRPGSRSGGLPSDFVMARPVTPELNTAGPGIGHRARGAGAAFPTRQSWHTNLPRASSADGGSRRSSRMEPDSPMYIRSPDWEPTQHAPEPEPGPTTRVAPTGRIFQADSTEEQRERELAAIHAKYGVTASAAERVAGMAAEEEPEALLCPKHRAEQDAKEAEATPNSRTQSVSFLFCGDCFAVQAAQKHQQAEDERKRQQALDGAADPIRQAAELKFGKSIAGRMLGEDDEPLAPEATRPRASDRSRTGATAGLGDLGGLGGEGGRYSATEGRRRGKVPDQAKGLQVGHTGCWESADRDQPHHYPGK